jgi:hypothetical protein
MFTPALKHYGTKVVMVEDNIKKMKERQHA